MGVKSHLRQQRGKGRNPHCKSENLHHEKRENSMDILLGEIGATALGLSCGGSGAAAGCNKILMKPNGSPLKPTHFSRDLITWFLPSTSLNPSQKFFRNCGFCM